MTGSSQTRLTAEQLYARPDRDRCELVRGALRVFEPPGGRHGAIAVRLAARLAALVEAGRLGTVLEESGYVLRRDPDTVRGPDISFIAASRLPPGVVPVGFIPDAPDLAVEILSAPDRPAEVEEKVADYLGAGTRLVWVVDPRRRRVIVHRGANVPRVLGAGDVLDGEEVVPGFRLPIEVLFGDGSPAWPS
ncbi:MAG TPA: Uma2 family endonuclease [Gemmatimonadales bacterium]